MAKRKRKSFWSPAAVTGRIVWGRGGFKGAVRQVRREVFGPQQKARVTIDPGTGKLKAAGARQRTDGTWEVKPKRPAKKVTPKQRIAQMQTRVAEQSDLHAKHLKAQAGPKPMTQRVKRAPNGTFNGSVKATPQQQADAAYLNAVRAAERAEQYANRPLET